MNTFFSLRAFARLHFGLADLSGATSRSYGGLGVAIDGLCAEVWARGAGDFHVEFGSADREVCTKTSAALDRARQRGLGFAGRFSVVRPLPGHVGVGSTTATTMAILQAIAIGNRWSLRSDQLIELSGRGRTSAVGCNTFFEGGLVADAGQPGHPAADYLPSLQPRGRPPSLRLGRWRMPQQWSVTLIMCTNAPSVATHDEADFFAVATPTDSHETLEQLGCVYHGIIPAVIEEDIVSFADSLRRYQSVGFKAREIGAQPVVVRNTLSGLWTAGFAAGLSSLGPALFVVTERAVPLDEFLPPGAAVLGPFRFRNSGYEVLEPGDPSADRRDA